MKKTLALVLSLAACGAALTGCASKDNVDSNPEREETSVVRSDTDSRYDNSSKTVPERVESTVDDVIDGGKNIVDDTASTAKDVVENITR
ncbi:MAG: hypothetical protein II574_10890 [Ruminococcus sp.]|nr:hypothetical protein [Ruminococcus sp.]